MRMIKLTPVHSAKHCTCAKCSHQERHECVQNQCACCACYETEGSLAVKAADCSCCSSDEESEDHCSEDDDDCCDQDSKKDTNAAFTKNQTTVYQVSGMDCPACARTIEKSVAQMPGIVAVKVHYSTGKMHVAYEDPSSLSTLPKQLNKLGYQAMPEKQNESGTPQRTHANKSLWEIVLSGASIAAGFALSFTELSDLLLNLLFAVALIISGRQPVRGAYYALKSRSLDMNVLMSAAVIGAVCINQWFEAATVVWLFALGAVLENRSVEKTRRSIGDLMTVAPSTAWIRSGDQLVKKAVDEVAVGTFMVVKPGERIPLDGTVTSGESSVNQAAITGESLPVDKVGEISFLPEHSMKTERLNAG
ncbi:lead, cadmium, zinc and mercury transporting ATPase [Sporolactobacillus inulinus]|uniref:Lead, cadmium, zinc and mercury transporting ATPase n=1 Tax=Sporolactobacillus inulinus TaxID=2078 RepID=A0A4Y1ZI86_9BACL|nr:cation transporter [Sporolactobacillus inulinus]GAY78634.1 lead, cadmium, zinc and mercury transporting ATPase [Sporolactobacillus inulinus]